MIVSTPNRRDMLLDILPESYAPFFYRAAHRWYFDADSLAHAGRAAGFEVSGLRFVQRYSLSNFLLWLRDRKPSGEARLAGLDTPVIEAMWAAHLEATGRSDAVYIRLKRPL